jgi:hypothetical protein
MVMHTAENSFTGGAHDKSGHRDERYRERCAASEQRMYQLIRQPKPVRHRRFEIEFLDPGAHAFAFTFG